MNPGVRMLIARYSISTDKFLIFIKFVIESGIHEVQLFFKLSHISRKKILFHKNKN